jgi:23S rRNA (uracil1939-C5)-methyltransferase
MPAFTTKRSFHAKQRQPKIVRDTAEHKYRPPSPHLPPCVGCPWISFPYAEQLSRKRESVRRALAAYPSLGQVEVPAVGASPHQLGYRARIKLVVRATRGEIATGLYVPGTHRVIDISSCPVHPRPVNQVTHYLKRKILELGIAPYDERDDSGQLRYVDFRYSFARRELSVTLVTRHREFPQGIALARSLSRKFSFITGVIQNINEQRGNVIWGERNRLLSGRDTLMEEIGPFKLGFPAGVFSQANPAAAKKIYEKVAEMAALTREQTALDLYCGVGPISLYLAGSARLVCGVDESSAAVDAAKQNARRNGVGNCRFFGGDVAEQGMQASRMLQRTDLVVLNPPRKGVQPSAMDALVAVNAPRIIYVSCNPESLARDLDRLAHHTYHVSQIQPFDLFPQTEQVETVALLCQD